MTIHHIITIQIGSTPETQKLLQLLDDYINNPDKIQEIMDKLNALNDDIKSTIE